MARQAKVTRVSKATREKIIKAASRAFALNGYEGASIRTIVAEADVNQAAINYHFGSKEGLYRAVLQAAVRALMSDLIPQQKKAIELAYFEGLSHTEIAETLHEPLGTVKSWIRNGLLRLKEGLQATS